MRGAWYFRESELRMADAGAAGGEGEDGYRWEGGYEKTWETLQEDQDGLLEFSVKVGLLALFYVFY